MKNNETRDDSPYAMTVAELLRRWDEGRSIWSLEMGGIGPGYEQAIQVAAIEIARVGKDFVPTGDNEKDGVAWDVMAREALRPINEGIYGLSGAQYGAASWLAWQWCHRGGPAALIERAKEKAKEEGNQESARLIQVCNHWPRAPESAVSGAAK